MKVLFAIRDESNVIDSLVRKYKKDKNKNMLYKEAKNFTAITREVQENNDYDRIIISDNVDEKINNSEDKEAILLKKLKGLLSVAKRKNGKSIPIIFICKSSKIAKSLMELKIYNFLLKKDAGKKNIYELINNPRTLNEAKEYYRMIMGNTINTGTKKSELTKKQVEVQTQEKETISNKPETKSEIKKQNDGYQMDEKLKKYLKYLNREGLSEDNYISKFEAACEIFDKKDIKELIDSLNPATKNILKRKSSKYKKYIPKEVNVKEKQAVKEEPVVKKRGRGRPRKNPIPDEEVETGTTTVATTTGAVKRGRGRPRKNPIPVETVETVQKVEKTKKTVENSDKNAKKEIKNEENTKKIKNKVKEKVEEKIPEKVKKKAKDSEDWDLEEDDDMDQIQSNQDEFEFDFDEDKAVNLSSNDTDDFEFDEVRDQEKNSDDEFEFDEEDEENSDDDFELDEEDEKNSDDDFEFDEEDEENSDDDFEFDEEDEENSDDDFEFDEEDEKNSDDEFEFDEEDEENSDDDFEFDEEDEDNSDDDFEFDEKDEENSDDDFEFDEEDEDNSDDDFEFDEEDDSTGNSEESKSDEEDDEVFDFDDKELEDDDFNFDDENESENYKLDDFDDASDESDEIDYDDENESPDFDDETSDDDFDFDDEDLANLDDEDFEDLNDAESSNKDKANEFNFNDDDNNLLDIDGEDLENLDDDEIDDLITDKENDYNEEDDLNLISDDDADEVQNNIINLDDDTDDDGILSSGSSGESSKGMIDFDSNMDDEEFVDLDDDVADADLDDEAEDNDIMNLDDDELLNVESENDDTMNIDDNAEDDDLVNLNDDAEDDSDDDFVFDLDEDDDDLKISDKPAEGTSGTAFSGIANKNYNPNYNISKQLDEIDEGETNIGAKVSANQNNQLVTIADTNIIDIGDNQKVVAFVGAHNSGNSFIVNNLAQLLSEQGVKTAVVDLTRNKNSYYIYTENEENLRNVAYSSFEKLKSGIADGIKVNKYLTVYTALPNSDADIDDKVNAMTTLLNNYSLVLLDCDFDTGLEFFNIAQDIFFVQSFDILTIQALTSFIKKLKMNKVEYENKMKIIINKYVNLSAINERAVVAAMSVYNSPDTTYQLDLFDRNSVEYFLVPFEEKNYCKYLEEVVKCKLTIRGYSKNLLNSLNKLAKIVYPINGKKGKNK